MMVEAAGILTSAAMRPQHHRIISKDIGADFYSIILIQIHSLIILLIFYFHGANQVPPSSIFAIWMIGWSGGVAKGAGVLITYHTSGESRFWVPGRVMVGGMEDYCDTTINFFGIQWGVFVFNFNHTCEIFNYSTQV